MFSHIVVPVDGSVESTLAINQARTLADVTGARITLITAVSSRDEMPSASARLADLARAQATSRVQINIVTRNSDAADAILDEVTGGSADLVVMRTRGHAGIRRAVLGSVTERVLRDGPTPVWLLPPSAQLPSAVVSILAPVDATPQAWIALDVAIELARQTGASIRILEVVVPMPLYVAHDPGMHVPIAVDPQWDQEAQRAAKTHVATLAADVAARGVPAEGQIEVANSVPGAILAAAAQHPTDVIVMSSEAHTGAARALLGSVTDAVVRGAACPVLVIRLGAAADSPAITTTTTTSLLR